MNRIYLAIPYSDIDKELSFATANAHAAELMIEGHIVFSPISHTHEMSKAHEMPTAWDFWAHQVTEFIKWCDELHVVCLPGWENSKGVQAEIKIAIGLKKSIKFRSI